MKKTTQRTPRNYDGPELTTHRVSDILGAVMKGIGKVHHDRPDIILEAWPEIIGPQLAPMTEAKTFVDGILTVKVKNSTLYSLLCKHDKPKIVSKLKVKFPNVIIKNIVFRIG